MTKAIGSRVKLDESQNKIAEEFKKCIEELLESENVKELDNYSQHLNTSRLQHSINVSYYSYLICRRLNFDYKSAARAGLLHDLYLYNRHIQKFEQSHTIYHPKEALKNARKIAELNEIEEDAILKHMWPVTFALPKYRESYIVTIMDKYSACLETYLYIQSILKTKTFYRYAYVFSSLLLFNFFRIF